MTYGQFIGVVIILVTAYFIPWGNIFRSQADREIIQNQVELERELRIEINDLKDQIRTAERLYDIQTGRLLEMTILAKKEIDAAIGDLYKDVEASANFVDKIINRERRK